jgi:uncharacterized protein (TIGR00645 family)
MERYIETIIFQSRWLLAPIYVGLIGALVMLLIKFAQELVHVFPSAWGSTESELVLAVLTLVDLALVGSLILMVIFSGYENFVSKIDAGHPDDRPSWMGKLGSSDLKLKLIASIVAISSIQILKSFMNLDRVSDRELVWMVGIHVMFVVSGVLLAVMDRLTYKAHK